MPIYSELQDYYNQFFGNHPDFEVIEPFSEVKEPEGFGGILSSKIANKELIISVRIPINYPYKDLSIYTKSIKGYSHLVFINDEKGSWFCLNVPFVENIEERLKLEIEKLSDWIITYLNGGFVDDHYDYLIFQKDEPYELFFCEEPGDLIEERFKEHSFGTFDLYKLKPTRGSKDVVLWADQLGNKQSKWNTSILTSENKEDFGAYWVFIEGEPAKEDKSVYSSWSELCENSFSESFISFINHQLRIEFAKKKKKFTSKAFGKKNNYSLKNLDFRLPLAIGYKIPSDKTGYEVHWNFLFIYYNGSWPIEKIGWASSRNIAEQRFFGRGAFCDELQNLSILIIGLGAIGSSVAEILVRGGIKNICLCDGDDIETGNICRSIYNLTDVGSNKAFQLGNALERISPYVKITYINRFLYGLPHFSKDYESQMEIVGKYDLIIDCSASNEVLYYLANLQIKSKIISLGITDKAMQMVCLSKEDEDSIYDKRRITLYSFGENVQSSFYEGAGCFYPTFEASFFDINGLLNMVLRHLNQQYLSQQKISSFHVSYSENRMEIDDHIVLNQKELNFTLTIYKSCIDIIHSSSMMNFPFEFGGVLVGGYADNGKHIYITDILIPDIFSNSPVSFKGDTRKINEQLLQLYNKTNGNIIYIGDWHSHPNMSNHYSGVDFRSIEQQAKSPTVSINNPVMAIISINKFEFEIGYYIYYEKKLYKFSEN